MKKFFTKFLIAASVLMFASVGAFANDADDVEIAIIGEMSAADFEDYFDNSDLDTISQQVFGGMPVDELPDDFDDSYIDELLDYVGEELEYADGLTENTVLAIYDGEIVVVVHLDSDAVYAFYVYE